MHRLCVPLLVCATALSLTAPLGAQRSVDQGQAAGAETRALPVTRVVLYKSGIGYFEHVATVTGNERLAVQFTSGQLDDVLKSLATADLGNGRVVGVGYESPTPIARRLESLRLPLGPAATTHELLSALRGARVELHAGSGAVTSGRLLGVERRPRIRDQASEQVDTVTVVTDRGDVVTAELGGATRLRVADAELRDEVDRYLDVAASSRDRDVRRMVISTVGAGSRQFFVSYVSEAAVWKTTYRLVFPTAKDGVPRLQGWAIVDNTVGEDWTDVELSLVAGAPQSFVQPLSQPLFTRRPEVPLPTGLVPAPQRHDATLVDRLARTEPESKAVASAEMPAAPPAEEGTLNARNRIVGGAAGRLAERMANERDARFRENLEQRLADVAPAAAAAELGELFEYRLRDRVTIRRNESALVPILQADVGAERVSLWNAGMGGRPRRAVWLRNTSDLTLDAGSVTVVDAGAFAGEGLVDTIKPGERRLLSYASDLGVIVDPEPGPSSGRVLRVRVSRGVLIRQAEERESRKYTIRNQDRESRTVVIEHQARPEWTISGEVKPVESTAGAHRFRVEVAAGATAVVQVDEMRPAMAQYSLAQLDDQQLTLIVQRAPDREALERALRPVLDKRAEVARLDGEIQAREAEVAAIGQDQSRVRENMKALERSQAERRLLDRYVRELDTQETRLDEIERELVTLRAARQTAADELDELIRTVSLDVTF